MNSKKLQSKAGIPEKRRGQQMGDERSNPNQMAEAEEKTPALRGRRKEANKMFADDSMRHVGGDATGPSSNSPSTPAAMPQGAPIGESGGEKVFKRRLAKTRRAK